MANNLLEVDNLKSRYETDKKCVRLDALFLLKKMK